MIYPTRPKHTRTISFICLIVGLFLVNDAFAKVKRLRCMWRDDPSTSMVIGWDQVNGSNPVLHYGTSDQGTNPQAYPKQQTPDRISKYKGQNNHFVRLKGLTPDKTYYFVISDSDGVSKRYSFKTIPNTQDTKLSIIAGGDSRNHRDARKSANIIVSKLRPNFVMFGGDMTSKDVAVEWKGWFDDWQATIAPDGRMTPIVVTRGNHEYSNETLREFFDVKHYDLYYKMSFANDLLHVYTLNTMMATGGDQKNWLEGTLRNNNRQVIWKMAQYHYTIRPHTKRKAERNDQYVNWATLFDKYGMDLVVESDAHVVKTTYPIRPSFEKGSDEGFIRDDENGTVYVGEGCWGAPLRENDDNKSWTRNSGSFNQFKWITVDKTGISVRTVKTDNASRVKSITSSDRFSAPEGLEIWNPSNGAVIEIKKPTAKIASVPYDNISKNAEEICDNDTKKDKSEFGTISKEAPKATIIPRGEMKILDFSAALDGSTVSLSWSSENEPDNMTYEIQHSFDGRTYKTIKSIKSQAFTGRPNDYLVRDQLYDIEKIENGLSYRIKRVLPNGNAKIFAPAMVGADLKDWKLYSQISPDASGRLQIKYSLDRKSDVSIRLLSVRMREIRNTIYSNQDVGNYTKSIDLQDMPKGSYIVVIKSGRQIVRRYRVVKS